MNYALFENISIDDYLSIYSYKDSNFYNFCIANNLKNLKEIFEFFKTKEILIKNPNSRAEILGIFDILKFVYLNELNTSFERMNTECVIFQIGYVNSKSSYLVSKYEYLIRRLGFSKSETTAILRKLKNGKTIGDAIVDLYYDMALKTYICRTYRDYPVRLIKIEFYANYYKYYKDNLNYLDILKNGINDLNTEISELTYEKDLLDRKIKEKEKALDRLNEQYYLKTKKL